MYLVSENHASPPQCKYGPKISAEDSKIFANYKGFLDKSISSFLNWVKVCE